jgi:ribulose kinase
MDVRAAEQAAQVAASGDAALRVNSASHGPVSAEWMIPKALWLRQHEPAVFERAMYICEFQDYLNFRLTGRMVGSVSNTSARWHHNAAADGPPLSLLARLGLEALADKWPQIILPLGAVIAGLTSAAAAHLGLPAGTPVAQGGPDAFIAMVGLGVVRPEGLAFITGSSHLHLGLSRTPFQGQGIWGTYRNAVLPGLHVVEGGQTSTGSVINWFKQLLGAEVTYDQLNTAAAQLPPGAEGVVVLDHFQGNRTPYTDPNSRGVIAGLTLKHGPAHIFRAMLEGIAFGTELILESMRANGFAVAEATVCGGATRSELWLQIHADVSGIPLHVTAVPEAPALGSAILAAVGAGWFDDIPTAAASMVKVVRTIEPHVQRHEAYQEPYQAYKDSYPALRDILHRQARLGTRSPGSTAPG